MRFTQGFWQEQGPINPNTGLGGCSVNARSNFFEWLNRKLTRHAPILAAIAAIATASGIWYNALK